MNIDKWKKAVIHLECATDSVSYYDKIKRIEELQILRSENKISDEDYFMDISFKSRDLRYHGTAIFFEHNENFYLITARHVVWDELSGQRDFEENIRLQSNNSNLDKGYITELNNRNILNSIFPIIFRVPSFNESFGKDMHPSEFLMNLGAGAPFELPYTFSNSDVDLAIISLKRSYQRFVDELIKQGYVPIKIEDIADEPIAEGQDVFAIGFPSATALIREMEVSPAIENWSASYFSLPVCSFGKVSMLNDKLNFFWTDISIYPGNSGGPIVCDNKLVGIVIAQAIIPIEESMENLQTRIPYGKIIKAKYIKELLEIQEKKDNGSFHLST